MLRTPLGNFTPVFDEADALVMLEHFPHTEPVEASREMLARNASMLRQAQYEALLQKWFNDFFKGIDKPSPIALAPQGTPHQQRVWQAISAIPFGQTRSYSELAAELGSGPRAVGTACGRNPIILMIPCHRVLGSNGALGGYSGFEGLKTKQWLLDHEQKFVQSQKLAA